MTVSDDIFYQKIHDGIDEEFFEGIQVSPHCPVCNDALIRTKCDKKNTLLAR